MIFRFSGININSIKNIIQNIVGDRTQNHDHAMTWHNLKTININVSVFISVMLFPIVIIKSF